MKQAYHFVGLDIHKKTVAYCEKTITNVLVSRGTIILMETGIEYDGRKIHGKKYFSALVDKLHDVPKSVTELLRMTHSNMELFECAQRKLLRALAQHKTLGERVELLKSVPGVGDVTALT